MFSHFFAESNIFLLNITNSLYVKISSSLKGEEQTGTQAVPSDCEEKHFYCEAEWALAQVAWRGFGVFSPGDIENPSGHNQRIHMDALGHLMWAEVQLQPQPFYDSVISWGTKISDCLFK